MTRTDPTRRSGTAGRAPARTGRWAAVAVAIVCCLAPLAGLGGCALRVPADEARLSTILEGEAGPTEPVVEQWPQRLARDEVRSLLRTLAGRLWLVQLHEVRRYDENGTTRPAEPSSQHPLGTVYAVDVTGTEAGEQLVGSLRGVVHAEEIAFRSYRRGPVDEQRIPGDREFDGADLGAPEMISDRMTFLRLLEPASPEGLALQLVSARPGNDRSLTQALLDRGWAVLVMDHPSLWPDENGGILLTGDDPEAAGRRMAWEADQWLGEMAFAAETVLDHLAEARPGLTQTPLVAVGTSAGAIVLPAVAARLQGRLSAAVLIAGGSDLSLMIERAPSLEGLLQIDWLQRRPTDGDWASIRRTYRETSRLDPLRTAAALRRVPVLQLHASFDGIVPARTGEALWEDLGRPERWSYPTGHIGLIFLLPVQAPAIVRWIDRQVEVP